MSPECAKRPIRVLEEGVESMDSPLRTGPDRIRREPMYLAQDRSVGGAVLSWIDVAEMAKERVAAHRSAGAGRRERHFDPDSWSPSPNRNLASGAGTRIAESSDDSRESAVSSRRDPPASSSSASFRTRFVIRAAIRSVNVRTSSALGAGSGTNSSPSRPGTGTKRPSGIRL
jgi:hypothetical protein